MVSSFASKWLLVIIGATPYVEGDTRLQKYGILAYKRIPELKEFYSDWKSGDYGGFSPKLATDLKHLRAQQLVITHKIIKGKMSVNRYEISDEGREVIRSLVEEKKDLVKRVCEIPQYYFSKTLNALLGDVYLLYPEYTKKSTIRAKVGIEKIKGTMLSPEFEIPFAEENKIEVNLSNLSTKQHVYNDEELREELSKMVGLSKIPNLDSKSFDRLSGILKNKIKSKEIDSVELVQSFRGS